MAMRAATPTKNHVSAVVSKAIPRELIENKSGILGPILLKKENDTWSISASNAACGDG